MVAYNASVILFILTYSQSFGLYSGKAKIIYRDVKLPDCETQNREHQKYGETTPKAWSWLQHGINNDNNNNKNNSLFNCQMS